MRRYTEYKDSGVPWIGEIPLGWRVGRPKYNYYLKGRIGWQGLKSDEFVDNTPYYLVTGIDFRNGRVDWSKCYHITKERFAEAPEIHVKSGDLLVTKDGTIGKVAYIEDKPDYVSLNSHLLLMRPLNNLFDNRFLFWVIQCQVFENYYGVTQSGSIMASLSQEKISNFSFPLPSKEEQAGIANYLENKIKIIDSMIDEAKVSIEEYKAWKASIIYEAVTKGLDKDVEMKDSGVEWIGEMPSSWDACALKHFTTKIGSGKTPSGGAEVYTDTGVMFIRSQNVYNTGLLLDEVSYISEEVDSEMKNTRVQYNDVLLNITGGSIGRCCLYDLPGTPANVNQHVCIIRTEKQKLLPQFLRYFWNSSAGPMVVDQYQTGGNRQGLNFEQIGMTKIPICDIEEQKQIVEYLDVTTKEIDDLLSEKGSLISDLEAYKKSLIFEVVTGKRKVV